MKIFILGLPASGKTTLAKKLSAEKNIPVLELDTLFAPVVDGKAQRLMFEDIEDELNDWLAKDDWIIEGVYPIERVMEQADEVTRIETDPLKCIARQWKRFAKDKEQRQKYGWRRNIGLSCFILALSTGKWGVRVHKNDMRTPLPSLQYLLENYGAHTTIRAQS